MFVYTYICLLKNVQINKMGVGGILSISTAWVKGSIFLQLFWHIFENKKDLALIFKWNFSNV